MALYKLNDDSFKGTVVVPSVMGYVRARWQSICALEVCG